MERVRIGRLLLRALVVAALAVPSAFALPAAAADGTIQGQVTRAGGVLIPGSVDVVGVKACISGEPGPNCPAFPGSATSVNHTTGAWNLSLPPGAYDLYVISLGSAPSELAGPTPVIIPDGAAAPNQDFEIQVAVVEGTVLKNGAPLANTGVGTCPSNEPGPFCPNLRSQGTDGSGSYGIALPVPGNWRSRAFHNPGPGGLIFSNEILDQAYVDGQLVTQNFTIPPFGTVTGTLFVNGSPAPTGIGAGVGACLAPEVGPGCPSLRFAFTDANGNYALTLPAGTWNMGGFVNSGVRLGPGQSVTVADGDTTVRNFTVDYASVTGTVTDINDQIITTGSVFVAACRGVVPVTAFCDGFSVTSVSPVNGSYTLTTGTEPYSIAAAHFPNGYPNAPLLLSSTTVIDLVGGQVLPCDFVIEGAAECDGVTDAQEDAAPNGGDGNSDGTPDSEQANVTSLPNAVDDAYLTVEAPAGTTLTNVEAIDPEDLPAPPNGASLPVGVLGFDVQGVAPGGTVQVEIFGAAGANQYWKFQNNTWVDFTSNASFGDPIVLSLTDGGAGDADGVANGVIVDPGAPLVGTPTFDFDGFFSPVNNRPAFNTVKAGSAVPVKFSLGGDFGLDIFDEGYPKSEVIECDADADTDGIESTVTANSSGLQYDASSDTYTYVWKTSKSWTGCRQLVLRFSDGTTAKANFEF